MSTLLIKGGTIISATGRVEADVLIDGERIGALIAPGTEPLGPITADHTIDASRKYVFPGGVDAHTHMEMPFGGTRASDTFETGSRAAAYEGYEIDGHVDVVVSRGTVIVDETGYVGRKDHGQYIKRGLSQYLL